MYRIVFKRTGGITKLQRTVMNKDNSPPYTSIFQEGFDPTERLIAAVLLHSGTDLSGFKYNFLLRRVQSRIHALNCGYFEAYVRIVEALPEECTELLNALGIQTSMFFRNPEVFLYIQKELLPAAIEMQEAEGQKEVRIWSVGCSSGEEPYTMAILAREAQEKGNIRFHIFGTDINSIALNCAREGIYARDRLTEARLGIIDTYFTPVDTRFQINTEIRDMVTFSRADFTGKEMYLPQESIFSTFHFVFCRNVLIYYAGARRERAFNNLIKSVMPGGYLILGEAEILPNMYKELFHQTHPSSPIYRKH